jgi:hypothetical protein
LALFYGSKTCNIFDKNNNVQPSIWTSLAVPNHMYTIYFIKVHDIHVPKSTTHIMSHYLIILITIIAAAALARKESLICIRQLSTRL